MSYLATTSTLDIGDSTSTTVNINSANILNLGKNTGAVNIRGLDLLFTSDTAQFASYTPGADNGPSFNSTTTCFYLLPLSTTQNLLIQWGYVNDSQTATRNFARPYASTPYLYCTKYNNGNNVSPALIESVSSTNFRIDSEGGNYDKSSFTWLAIGVANK